MNGGMILSRKNIFDLIEETNKLELL